MIQTKNIPLLILACIAWTLSACQSETGTPVDTEPISTSLNAINTLLENQEDAWNEGDINAFMEGYWNSDSLRFASGGNVRRGWQATLDRYLATYPDRATMGQLAFVDLEMRRLSPEWATVFGRFRLTREAPLDDLTGLFTLMFEKRDGGWIIVSDHTSAE
ncbi:MAG: DUF4440 domain-containing protein [Rhodothermales bacterium]